MSNSRLGVPIIEPTPNNNFYPKSPEEAKRRRRTEYEAPENCPVCAEHPDGPCKLRHVHSGACKLCARHEASELVRLFKVHNAHEAQRRGMDHYYSGEPCVRSGHPGRKALTGECYDCLKESENKNEDKALRESASAAGEKWYTPTEPCSKCGEIAPRRTTNNSCQNCERLRSGKSEDESRTKESNRALREAAIEAGERWYTPAGPCSKCGAISPRRTINNSCQSCEEKKRPTPAPKGPSPRQKALAAGEKWYTPTEPCPKCHTLSPKRVNNGSCRGCEELSRRFQEGPTYTPTEPCSKCGEIAPRRRVDNACLGCLKKGRELPDVKARNAARKAGEETYTPSKPCPKCGETAPRFVMNNHCSKCKPGPQRPDGRETASSRLMQESPDMVIDRSTARTLGFKVYRTGKACQRGHTGWRFVSNGACLECKK